MKAPEWKKTALLVTDDSEVRTRISLVFGPETMLLVHENAEDAADHLSNNLVDILIIDTKTTETATGHVDAHSSSPFVELCQLAGQINPGLTIIILSVRVMMQKGLFAEKSGATLIMDRHNISPNIITYAIRILRKRTFRKVLVRDLEIGKSGPVDIYHYLPLNNSYVCLLKAGHPHSDAIFAKLQSKHIRHLYVKESELEAFLRGLKSGRSDSMLTEDLVLIRDQFRKLLISLFNASTDSHIGYGRTLFNEGQAIVEKIDQLIQRYPDPVSALSELPSQRWSSITHSINCAIYVLIFAKAVGLNPAHDLAVAALLHNIGLSHINQNILLKKETEFSKAEQVEYQIHCRRTLDIIKQKNMPLTPMMEHAILHHHENFDGTGFPDSLASVNIPIETALLSLVGSFDYFNTVRPGEQAKSLADAWRLLEDFHRTATSLKKKFNPILLEKIGSMIMAN